MANKNARVLLGGDFNCGGFEWSTMQVLEGVSQRHVQSQLLELIKDHCLSQVVKVTTRNDRALDLLFTNSPSRSNRVKGMPPIDKADHDIIYVKYDIKAKQSNKPRGRIFLLLKFFNNPTSPAEDSPIKERIWKVSVTHWSIKC